jgi:hypothetical protein
LGKQGKMVNKIKDKLKKVWNILNGSDKNMDGKVDIHDAMLAAKQKTSSPRKNNQRKK